MTQPTNPISLIPPIAPPIAPVVDEQANREVRDFGSLMDAQDGEHGIILNRHLFKIACVAIWILFALFFVMLLIWFYHLVTPLTWHWLVEKELQSIERFLYASTLVSLAGKYFSKFKLIKEK